MAMGLHGAEFPGSPGLTEAKLIDSVQVLEVAISLEVLKRVGLIAFEHVSIFCEDQVKITMLEPRYAPFGQL